MSEDEVTRAWHDLDRDAEAGGYHLNPDQEFTQDLVRGLMANEARYGYQSCPCRMASGDRARDLDIVCPCDYRDPDLSEFGTCY
jgi:ferredoxin-thioredoxin reductase catalytic chain